ncbi:MAG: ABC transporter substrate-binding protein [Pseudomonadota bacterium]
MKQRLRLPTFLVALLAALALLAATPLPVTAQTVRVVTEDTPYSFLRGGQVNGSATEVVRLALLGAGLDDYRIDVYPWARAYDLALREPNVLIYLIARTPQRESRFQWVGELMRMRYHLYALPDRTDLRIGSLDDARPYTIGVVRDDVRQQYLAAHAFTRLAVTAQPAENVRKLLFRQVDMVALTEGEATLLCENLKPDCAGLRRVLTLEEMTTGLYMAYSLATPAAIVARTRAAFDTLRGNGTLARLVDPFGRLPPSSRPGTAAPEARPRQ